MFLLTFFADFCVQIFWRSACYVTSSLPERSSPPSSALVLSSPHGGVACISGQVPDPIIPLEKHHSCNIVRHIAR